MKITNNYMDYDEVEEQAEAAPTVRMLMTTVGGRDFAVLFDDIIEIASAEEIFPVPEFPSYAPGFAMIDEKSVPIIDARRRFGFPPKTKGERSVIVVAKDGDMRVGLMVDSVSRFRDTKEAEIKPSVKLNDEAYTRYVTGMFMRSSGSMCYIISPKLMYSLTERETLFGGEGDSIKIDL